MNRAYALSLVMICALAMQACGPTLPPVWLLDGFRVLGIGADRAEVEHDDSVTLTLVTADSQTRDVQTLWVLCPQVQDVVPSGRMTSSTGMFGSCPSGAQLGNGPQVSFFVPNTPGVSDDTGRETFTVFGFACAGGTIGLPTADSQLPTCDGDDADGWLFTRSIYVHTANALNPANQNPHITTVWFGGDDPSPLTTDTPPTVSTCADPVNDMSCTQWQFKLDFSANSRESYRTPDPLNPNVITTQNERLTTGFVISAGTLDGGFRTDSDIEPESRMQNGWKAPSVAGPIDLYIYVLDGRGGFDWTKRTIMVR